MDRIDDSTSSSEVDQIGYQIPKSEAAQDLIGLRYEKTIHELLDYIHDCFEYKRTHILHTLVHKSIQEVAWHQIGDIWLEK